MEVEDANRRSYKQFCGLARALDVVGERWTLLILRNLLLGPRRYGRLLEELPGITSNLLAKRLKQMEAAGLIGQDGQRRYRLEPAGAALEPAIMELGRWGGRFLSHPGPDDRVDVGWGLISLKRRYKGGLDAMVEFRIDGRVFLMRFDRERLEVRDEPDEDTSAPHPALVLSGALEAFRAWLFANVDPDALVARGALEVTGEETTWALVKAAFWPRAVAS